MTERAQARHRADVRPSTPLTGFTSTISAVVGDHASTLGRGGVVVAVSGGLVAGMGLPASAAAGGPPKPGSPGRGAACPGGGGSAATGPVPPAGST